MSSRDSVKTTSNRRCLPVVTPASACLFPDMNRMRHAIFGPHENTQSAHLRTWIDNLFSFHLNPSASKGLRVNRTNTISPGLKLIQKL